MSVDSPDGRYIINVDENKLEKTIEKSDCLSPPWFLDKTDSMGVLTKELTVEEKKFGEAIVEFRSIRNVGKWFLRRCSLNENVSGEFLSNPETLGEHVEVLFTFLSTFGTVRDVEDIKLGMTYAVLTK